MVRNISGYTKKDEENGTAVRRNQMITFVTAKRLVVIASKTYSLPLISWIYLISTTFNATIHKYESDSSRIIDTKFRKENVDGNDLKCVVDHNFSLYNRHICVSFLRFTNQISQLTSKQYFVQIQREYDDSTI